MTEAVCPGHDFRHSISSHVNTVQNATDLFCRIFSLPVVLHRAITFCCLFECMAYGLPCSNTVPTATMQYCTCLVSHMLQAAVAKSIFPEEHATRVQQVAVELEHYNVARNYTKKIFVGNAHTLTSQVCEELRVSHMQGMSVINCCACIDGPPGCWLLAGGTSLADSCCICHPADACVHGNGGLQVEPTPL